MRASHDDRWTDAAAPYLLHAMPAAEEADFEAHLQTCAACRLDVEHLRVAAEALPNSPVQLAPPSELKDRIMAVVHAEAELLRAAGARADEPAGEPPPRRRRFAVLRPGWLAMRPGLALAGAVAVLMLGVVGGVLGTAGEHGDAVRGGRTVVADVVPPGAKARLVLRHSGHSTLVTEGMPSPGSGRVYQVWLKKRGVKTPRPTNALFNVRSDGSASVSVPGKLDKVEAVLVTREPEGGSMTPSEQPVVSLPA